LALSFTVEYGSSAFGLPNPRKVGAVVRGSGTGPEADEDDSPTSLL
jgi:hypothetical protein